MLAGVFFPLVVIALIAGWVETRMLRSKGITEVTLSTSGTTNFTALPFPQPVGNTAPPVPTTPSPYQSYSAAWDTSVQVTWTPMPNAFSFDTSNINKLDVDQMGSNFRIIKTASPVFPVPGNR